MSATSDIVGNDEIMFRRVDADGWKRNSLTGEAEVHSSAFMDRKLHPSVDRARLCNDDPTWTQAGNDDFGVAELLTADIRTIDSVRELDAKQRPIQGYRIDVVADPLPDNIAHAEIRADPEITKRKPFDRLRAALAVLANRRGWRIKPKGCR